jgi:nitrate reductase assembly molybdenum cofactor insertion protein NarJ
MSGEAIARARGLSLLGRMLLGRMAADELSIVTRFAGVDAPPREEIEASYVAAFDLGVPPYASVFLELDGGIGGATTLAVEAAILGAGLHPTTADVAADHLGVMLVHLGALGQQRRRDEAAEFAARHLIDWLPAFVVALDGVDAPFWRGVVELALELVRQEVVRRPTRRVSAPQSPLVDPKSGLREIAGFFAAPSRCGLYLGRSDLLAVARAVELPAGFGTRRDRVETLLRAAAEYDALPRLCATLDELVATRAARLLALGLAPEATAPWTARLDLTRAVLQTLADEAGRVRASTA